MNGISYYVLFHSEANCFRNLKCCSFPSYQPCLVLKCLQLKISVCPSFTGRYSLGINTPVSLASHLFTTSVHGTEQLVRSIVGFETFLILIVFFK